MSETYKVAVKPRDPAKNKGTGSRASRKLRAEGFIPAIVYGHKQAPQPVTLTKDDAWELIKRSVHLAELVEDAKTETVLIKDIQWDHLGKEIIHMDFSRVDAAESIETEVRIDLRGMAPGVAEGGVLEHLAHSISVTCRADAIPDSIKLDVSHLHLGQAIHIRELTLPPGVAVNNDPDDLVVHVTTRAAETATAEAVATTAEPELIRARPEDKDKDKDKDKA